jgi:hypothetical protein
MLLEEDDIFFTKDKLKKENWNVCEKVHTIADYNKN